MRAGSRFREFTVGAFAAGMPLAVGEFAASLADRLREGATLIVSDLREYEGNQRILSKAGQALGRLGPVTSRSTRFRTDPPGPTTDLGRHFFDIHQISDDQAWPRVNNKVAFLVLEREDGSK